MEVGGASGDGGFEVVGVGEVDGGVDVGEAGVVAVVAVDVDLAGFGCSRSAGVGFVGVEPVQGFVDEAVDGDLADLVGGCEESLVDVGRTCGWQAAGGLGDLAGAPDLEGAVLGAGVEAGEAVGELEGVTDVGASGVGGAAEDGGELGDAELRDLRGAFAGEGEEALLPRGDRSDPRVHGVEGGPGDRGGEGLGFGVLDDAAVLLDPVQQ